jgi:hypothetical protein
MPRKSKTAMEEGFMKSFWAECAEIEDEYHRVVVLSAVPTTQKGVWSFQLSASALTADENGSIRNDKLSQRYPNSTSMTLAGFLWSMARRLCDQVADLEEQRPKA